MLIRQHISSLAARKGALSIRVLHIVAGVSSLGVAIPAALAVDGQSLPHPDSAYTGTLGPTIGQSSPQAYPKPVEAPKGAPNVLIILTDDVGFAAATGFGGAIPTPTFDRLASQGLRYNRFHTTALCAPTRAAMLTGRNAHAVGSGVISEMSTGYPGYTSIIPKSAATMGQVLSMNGYSTAWIGKNHNTPDWEVTPMGPFEHWPNQMGFDYFYGFMGGATNQFSPELYENQTAITAPADDPDYILDRDLADHAINWLRLRQQITPDKPFFMHYAPGSAHAPNQAPREWVDRFKGRFDGGWDKFREEVFARQKKMGIIPSDAKLTPRPEGIPAWDSLTPDEKRLMARMMEAYAAQLAFCDEQIGRVIEELRQTGQFDNTIIFYVQGDNGSSGEGGIKGTTSDIGALNGRQPSVKDMVARIDQIGTSPYIQNNIPTGWAWGMDTPFQWTKAIASHFGGTRNGLVVTWPKHIRAHGEIRNQFHHVIDIAPTVYDAIGIEAPRTVNGIAQQPIDGVSMAYSFDKPKEASHRREQYFEMFGNRAYYKDGWMASTTPMRAPGKMVGVNPAPDSFPWELYHVEKDYSQANDLAKAYPAKLAELKADFDKAARRYNVYPIDASGAERITGGNRPYPLRGRTHFTYGNDPMRYHQSAFPDFKNKSWKIDISLEMAASASGTLITQGGRLGGWSLRLAQGKPVFTYRVGPDASDQSQILASRALSAGKHVLTAEFAYDGGGAGSGGLLTLSENGRTLAQGRIARTVRFIFQEGASIGRDYGTTMTEDYALPDLFEGTIEKVDIELKPNPDAE